MDKSKISVSNYVRKYSQNKEESDRIRAKIKNAVAEHIQTPNDYFIVNIHNMDANLGTYNLGEYGKDMYIMNLYSDKNATGEISYTKYGITLPPVGDGMLITDSDGIPIAEYREGDNKSAMQVNILIDAFKDVLEGLYIFEYILRELNERIIKPIINMNSWTKSNKRDLLLKRLESKLGDDVKANIAKLERDIKDYTDNIENYKMHLTRQHRNLIKSMSDLEKEKTRNENPLDNVIKDLNLIIQNDNIKDVIIKDDGNIEILTEELNIYADNDETYYGGEYRININMLAGIVKFFAGNDNGAKGFWTNHDPHPHVNGSSGTPCLGNLDSTVAELCAQNQIYALALICIDFLESTNTGDAAGSYVKYRDTINEYGERVEAHQENKECPNCGECYDEDEEFYEVYSEIVLFDDYDDNEYGDVSYVCEYCRDNAIWVEEVDAYTWRVTDNREESEY